MSFALTSQNICFEKGEYLFIWFRHIHVFITRIIKCFMILGIPSKAFIKCELSSDESHTIPGYKLSVFWLWRGFKWDQMYK